jgi:hypothetical protein
MQTKPMQTSTNSQDQSQRGQALVEFALVLLFIILPITFVLFDGAFMLFTLSNVTNAAREAAHAGSIYQTHSSQGGTQLFADYWAQIDGERKNEVKNRVRRWLQQVPLIDPEQCLDDAHLTVTYDPLEPEVGNGFREMDSLTVKVVCPHRLMFGLVSAGQIDLAGEATMKIEPGGTCPPDPDDPTKCDDGISP